MKLPSFKRLFVTDFEEEYQELVKDLVPNINDGFQNTFNALERRLTLKENIACTVKDVPIIVNASGTPTTDTFIKLDTTLTPLGVTIIDARNQTNSSVYPTSQPFATWQQTNNGLQLINVSGLQSNQTYSLRIIVWN